MPLHRHVGDLAGSKQREQLQESRHEREQIRHAIGSCHEDHRGKRAVGEPLLKRDIAIDREEHIADALEVVD